MKFGERFIYVQRPAARLFIGEFLSGGIVTKRFTNDNSEMVDKSDKHWSARSKYTERGPLPGKEHLHLKNNCNSNIANIVPFFPLYSILIAPFEKT